MTSPTPHLLEGGRRGCRMPSARRRVRPPWPQGCHHHRGRRAGLRPPSQLSRQGRTRTWHLQRILTRAPHPRTPIIRLLHITHPTSTARLFRPFPMCSQGGGTRTVASPHPASCPSSPPLRHPPTHPPPHCPLRGRACHTHRMLAAGRVLRFRPSSQLRRPPRCRRPCHCRSPALQSPGCKEVTVQLRTPAPAPRRAE
jgi:hypothetical protein